MASNNYRWPCLACTIITPPIAGFYRPVSALSATCIAEAIEIPAIAAIRGNIAGLPAIKKKAAIVKTLVIWRCGLSMTIHLSC